MKNTWLSVGKILVSLSLIPLWFAKIFHGVGHLPSQSNPSTIEQVDFYHSMFENITDIDYSFLIYISFGWIALSVVSTAFSLICPNSRKIRIGSHIIFGITVLVFLILLLLASSVGRGY